jgi:glycosyltransferase involved in cell wall biosynthesis
VREDVQVIVVDDNSPDADTYTERYPELSRPFLTFIRTPKRGGAGYARNIGMDYAQGKWLIFADADDFFVEQFDTILNEFSDHTEDIIYFKTLSVFSEDISTPSDRIAWLDVIFDRYFISFQEEELRCNHCVPWGKIMKKSFIQQYQLYFDEVMYSTDIYFAVRAGCLATSIKVENQPFYILTERAGSLASQFGQKPKELQIRAEVSFRTQKFINKIGFTPYFQEHLSISRYIANLYHEDKQLYRSYLYRMPEVYSSYLKALKHIRIWESGKLNKVKLYLFSLGLLTLKPFLLHR